MDNNIAESAIRPFTNGRRNWSFSKSQAGAKASANLYSSLIETAKANKLNIYDYLTHVFKKLSVAHSNEVIKTSFPYSSIHL